MYRCSCGEKCVAMPTARESACCLEMTEIEDKMSELQTLDPNSEATCITEHPGFLDMWVLPTTAHQIHHTHGQGALLEQDLLTSMLPAAVDHYQDSVNYILLCHTTLHRVSTADNMVLGIPRKASESGSAVLCCKQDKGGISFRWVHRF